MEDEAFDIFLFNTAQPKLTARGLIYIIFSSVGVGKPQEKIKLVRDKNSTLVVAPKGGKCVLVL